MSDPIDRERARDLALPLLVDGECRFMEERPATPWEVDHGHELGVAFGCLRPATAPGSELETGPCYLCPMCSIDPADEVGP